MKTVPTWAAQFGGAMDDLPAEWVARGHFTQSTISRNAIRVLTAHGAATCYPGDYVCLDAGGSFYPIPRAVFEGTHRLMADDE